MKDKTLAKKYPREIKHMSKSVDIMSNILKNFRTKTVDKDFSLKSFLCFQCY